MTIKQHGGIFGRNPTFNNVTVDGTLTVDQIVEKTGAAGIALDGVTLKDGNVVLTDGKGIDFSATAGTGTSELFNDYEEGTFTPTLVSSGASFTYGASTGGRYTKIGNRVYVSGFITTSSASGGTAAEAVYIGGLPFTAGAWATDRDYSLFVCEEVEAFAGDHPNAARVVVTTTTAVLFYRSAANGASSVLTYADLNVGSNSNLLPFSGFYRT